MKPLFIGIGLSLVASGFLLSLVAHHDGVLGAADPSSFLSHETTPDATARLLVLGTPDDTSRSFDAYRAQLLLPDTMEEPMRDGRWVAVRIEGMDAEAYLRIEDEAPAVGTLLVFNGAVQAYWPVYDAGTEILASRPVLFLEPEAYRVPLLFKE